MPNRRSSFAEMVPLSQAAQQLHISRERAARRVMNGELEGELLNGRWYVSQRAVRKAQRAAGEATALAS